jgi:hypothetical protein
MVNRTASLPAGAAAGIWAEPVRDKNSADEKTRTPKLVLMCFTGFHGLISGLSCKLTIADFQRLDKRITG